MRFFNLQIKKHTAKEECIQQQDRIEKSNAAFYTLVVLSLCAVILLITYAWLRSATKQESISIGCMILLIGFASFATGNIIGFLFGIPRTLQHNETAVKNGADSSFQTNTNLEQISDWVTKILVGVGLTQITEISKHFTNLTHSLGEALPGIPANEARSISGMLIVFFLIDGFLLAYLWTRLFLAKIQSDSVDKKIDIKLKYSDQNDKQATSIAYNQLNLPPGEQDFSEDELVNVFKDASGNVLNTIFFQTVNVRQIWKDDKDRISRTVPIFKALIKLDSGLEFPENFRELGYALKDQAIPDYKEALKYLDKAIDGFIKSKDPGIGMVYYNRALCKIKSDEEYINSQPSRQKNRDSINADLKEAMKDKYVTKLSMQDKDIVKWENLNP